MISYPFNGILVNGQNDRAIDADMERAFNRMRYTNGVFAAPADGLLVKSVGGMGLTVNVGGAHVDGVMGYEPNIRSFTLDPSSATLPRKDRVVMRKDDAEGVRNIEIYKKLGVPATTPSPPDLIRESNYYEVSLATILVPKGATEITASNITDDRMNPSLCGMVVPAIPYENQTAELWQQIKDSIDLVNAALDETVAGNLQNQIDGNKTDIEGLQTQVRPIPLGGTGATTAEQAITNLGIADYIVERGTTDGWAWEKWNSGKYVCWLTNVITINSAAVSTGIYGYEGIVTIPVPVELLGNVEMFTISGYRGSGTGLVTRIYKSVNNNNMQCYLAGAQNTVQCQITNAEIIGRWK